MNEQVQQFAAASASRADCAVADRDVAWRPDRSTAVAKRARCSSVASLVGCLPLILSLGACDEKKQQVDPFHWGEKKSNKLTAGPHTISIPDRWRDISELQNSNAPKPGPGYAMMTPEKASDGALRTNILLNWAELPAGTTVPSCDELAQALAKQYGAAVNKLEKLVIDGDAGCSMQLATDEANVSELIRFQGDHELVVQWTRMKTLGESDAGSDRAVWEQVKTALHVPSSAGQVQ